MSLKATGSLFSVIVWAGVCFKVVRIRELRWVVVEDIELDLLESCTSKEMHGVSYWPMGKHIQFTESMLNPC